MADLLELSTRIIDSGVADEPVNRITQELSPVAAGIAMVESFSHVVAISTDDGLALFDTSGVHTAGRVVASLRRWSEERVHSIFYTHGHVDHVGGCGALLADAAARGHPRPRIVGHEAVAARFARYDATNGYNLAINRRQFGGVRVGDLGIGGEERFLPPSSARPDLRFRDRMALSVGGLEVELRHSRGETDDHLWAWLPQRRAICSGDFFLWFFPNAGNPQKVQRYPVEWTAALREMAGIGAELLLPAHGLPIQGSERIRRCLLDTASALEHLVTGTLERMNAGAPLDAILQEVRVPDALLAKPYLRPLYDEPEFVVRNVWRLYGGWHDGNPAHLKPPRESALAAELATLAGGALRLAGRARELAGRGELRLACSLVELAARAEPASRDAHAARAEIYELRRKQELSLMSKGIYAAAARESRDALEADGDGS